MKKIFILLILLYTSTLVKAQIGCNNWFSMPPNPTINDRVKLGNISVITNQITVEASFYCPLDVTNGGTSSLNLVSKHENPGHINYLLRTTTAEIGTTTGFYKLQLCDFVPRKINHAAMVYNGSTLRYYRNGFLVGIMPASGNLQPNSLITTLGNQAGINNEPFQGFINEVKIWNVARTQAQIKQYMNTTLPNPTTQVGLLAYYRFNSLTNLQGNTAYNGVQNGGATINNTIPNCNFIADSTCKGVCPRDTSIIAGKCFNINTQLSYYVRSGSTYSWSPSTGLNSTTIQAPTTSVNTNTTYVVTITDTIIGCTYRDTVKLNVFTPAISNMRDTTICLGDTIRFNTIPGQYYPNMSGQNVFYENNLWTIYATPTVTTTYIFWVSGPGSNNSLFCGFIKDTVVVTVNNCHCEDSCNWSLTGNTYVKPYSFIGSINNADFKVRTNNTQRMVVTAAGKIGLNTLTPSKTLDVNGEVVVRTLPAATPNDKLVLANATGELKSLAPGAAYQYLSGNGTWQNLPSQNTSTVNSADQGVTLDGTTVLLGDYCGKGGAGFRSDREINFGKNNLYFNTSEMGKIYMGNSNKEAACKELNTRLEISSDGLKVDNSYISPNGSPSGLRFTNLTANDEPIENESRGVLSLDKDGDVIWVKACCNGFGGITTTESKSILDRLDKLEAELKSVKNENTSLKNKLNQIDVTLDSKNNTLEQNVPNPFTETTTIAYNIVSGFSRAEIIFSTMKGEIIKTVQLKNAGKGQINVAASFIARGVYSYSLIVDGKLVETKKMVKE
jgi:hypothetical protein